MAERAAAPVLALVFNAFVWGVSWLPFRMLHERGVHPLWSTALIYLFSLLCLLAVRPAAWRPFRSEPLLWLLAAAAGLTNVGFNWGVTVGDVVRVVLLFYLMPAWSVLLAWPLLGERPTPAALLRLALALAGVLTVLHTGGGEWPLPREAADWLGLMGGFSFALTNILLRKLHDAPAEARVLAMFGGGGALAAATAAAGLAQGLIAAVPGPQAGWVPVALLLGTAFLASNMALQYGASRLPAHTTALVMLSEVVFASLSSVLLDAAQVTWRVLLGALLILSAAGWSAWEGARSGRPGAE